MRADSHHNTDSPSRLQHEPQSFASPRLRSRSLPSHPDATSTEEFSPGRSDIPHNFRRNHSPPSLPPHSSRSVTLPDFWSTNPVGYFNAIELLFQDSGITAESTKYALLITALSKDKTTLARVTDIFQQLNAESPYSQMKTALLKRCSNCHDESPHSLLYQCNRGKDSISDFLLRIKTRLGPRYNEDSSLIMDLVRHHLLESVGDQVRLSLYHYESGSVEELAYHADRLLNRTKDSASTTQTTLVHHYSNQRVPNQQLVNETVETRLDSLRRDVTNLASFNQEAVHTPKANTLGVSHRQEGRSNNAPPPSGFRNINTNPQSYACYYHDRFGSRAYKCDGPPCPFSTSARNHTFKGCGPQLHSITPQPASLQTDSPFFVTDRLTSTNFLVDTGAAHSLFPYAVAIEYNILQSFSQPLQALGGGYVPVLGTYKTHVDLGFSRLFEHEFCVVEMEYGILGADFLTQHKLIVDLSSRRLTESTEIEQHRRYSDDSLGNEFVVNSDQVTNVEILSKLRADFPEVFNGDKRSRLIKHSVVADVETLSDIPIHSTARRLNPEQFQALKSKLKRLLDQGIIERSQSPWAAPIVLV